MGGVVSLLLAAIFLTGCGDSGLPPVATDQIRARFPAGGVVDVIVVDAVNRLPLRKAELVAPDGQTTPASYLNVVPSPGTTLDSEFATSPYAGNTFGYGNITANLAAPGGAGAPLSLYRLRQSGCGPGLGCQDAGRGGAGRGRRRAGLCLPQLRGALSRPGGAEPGRLSRLRGDLSGRRLAGRAGFCEIYARHTGRPQRSRAGPVHPLTAPRRAAARIAIWGRISPALPVTTARALASRGVASALTMHRLAPCSSAFSGMPAAG